MKHAISCEIQHTNHMENQPCKCGPVELQTALRQIRIQEIESEKIEETRTICCSFSISHSRLMKRQIDGERIRDICMDHVKHHLGISSLNVRYFTSDKASYMDTGFTALKTSFHNVERVRCPSHGINLVIKSFCEELKPLSIVIMKLIRKFLKAGLPTKRVTRM
jgi:hypothetical protein